MSNLSQREVKLASTKLAYGIDEVVELTGRCRTSIYESINRGQLRAVKSGRRTLIMSADLTAWLGTFQPIKPKPPATT